MQYGKRRRGTPPGTMRGPYANHTRAGKITDDQVRYIRSEDMTISELYQWLVGQGVAVEMQTIAAIRARKRKAGVPD